MHVSSLGLIRLDDFRSSNRLINPSPISAILCNNSSCLVDPHRRGCLRSGALYLYGVADAEGDDWDELELEVVVVVVDIDGDGVCVV